MKNIKNSKLIILFITICSLTINIVWILSDGWFEFTIAKTKYIERNESQLQPNIPQFKKELLAASMKMLSSEKLSPKPLPYKHSTIKNNFNYNIKGYDNNTSLFHWGGGWLMYTMLESTSNSYDSTLISKIAKIFDEKVMNEPIYEVDQSLFGISAIILYKQTKMDKYKTYANNLFHWLQKRDTPLGIPYRPNIDINLIDGLGMYNPFLIYYSKAYNDSSAYKLAIKQSELFIKYAVDAETGICSHGYRIIPPYIKVGSSNWGRGNSWYVLGICDININDLSPLAKHKISLLNKTLIELWNKEQSFSRYIGENGKEDISTTLPILYYLHKHALIKLTKKQVLNYSKYMHDGIMYNGSGECGGSNHYSDYSGSSPLTQAMMILLINTIQTTD